MSCDNHKTIEISHFFPPTYSKTMNFCGPERWTLQTFSLVRWCLLQINPADGLFNPFIPAKSPVGRWFIMVYPVFTINSVS